ncbi:AraC family transcriptional regulator [Streptococcus salivarius]
MDPFILDLLINKREQREWKEIESTMRPVPAKYFNGEPVYEFFQNLNDSLEINLQPIALSVNPINSFVPYHFHNYVEMIFPLMGDLSIMIEDEQLELHEGDIFIVGPNTVHKNIESGPDTVVLNIAIRPTAFTMTDLEFLRRNGSSSYLSDLLFFTPSVTDGNGIYTVFKTKDSDGMSSTIANIIYEYYNKGDEQSNDIIRYELLVLFVKLLRISSRSNAMISSQKTESHLLSFMLYIEKYYASATLEEMADHFGYNPSYLSTYLKKHTGKSFIKLVHLQRINVAADFLRYTQAPIEQIATKVGYENPSYFYKIFKKTMGLSPAEYRDNI